MIGWTFGTESHNWHGIASWSSCSTTDFITHISHTFSFTPDLQFDASRISSEWLNSLQLSEYVIFIWFDLFSLFINTWAILPCSGGTKLFNYISGKAPLLQYSIQLLWGECLACLFWQCPFHQHWPSPLNLGCIHISPTLLWCLIAGIKCSRSFWKLGNNMGGPSPPPSL